MIAALIGKVLTKSADRAIINVGGVGYEVLVSTDTVARMPDSGEDIFLYIHTSVREDAISLYGFLEEDEKELFLLLRTVSGIGPKLALAILSGMRVAEICQTIGAGDAKMLTTISGVGKRTAERICVELKEKVGYFETPHFTPLSGSVMTNTAGDNVVADAISALTNLGYGDSHARSALAAVKKRLGEESFAALKVEELIREALRTLA
jgi:Holliday junction DNA helicase RuvA